MAQLEKLPDWEVIEKRVFSEPKKGQFLLGGVEIPKEVREVLREQAKYLQKSQLWEVLNASTINEAVSTGLIQSSDFSHTQFGKAMWHYSTFIRKVVNRLAED